MKRLLPKKKVKIKDIEYLNTYTEHLEGKLRKLETEKQRLETENSLLRLELVSLRTCKKVLDKLRDTPLYSNAINELLEKELKKESEKKLQNLEQKVVRWYELHKIKQPPLSVDKERKGMKIEDEFNFKVVIYGQKIFTDKFCGNHLADYYPSESDEISIGIKFYIKKLILNNMNYKLKIWQLSEEERFKFLIPNYLFGTNGIILMYDITNMKNLKKLFQDIELVRMKVGAIPTFLALTELASKVGKFFEPNENYILTDITSETGQNGEHALELLSKRLRENFEQ